MTWKLSGKPVMGKIIKPGLIHPPNYDHAPVLAFVTVFSIRREKYYGGGRLETLMRINIWACFSFFLF